MDWTGINRKVTDIGAPDGMGYYLANSRLRQSGEAQRRYGLGKSTADQAAAAIVGMAVTATPNGPIYMNTTMSGGGGGGVNGGPNPNPPWVDGPPWIPPGGVEFVGPACILVPGGTFTANSTSPSIIENLSSGVGAAASLCRRRMRVTVTPSTSTLIWQFTNFPIVTTGVTCPDWPAPVPSTGNFSIEVNVFFPVTLTDYTIYINYGLFNSEFGLGSTIQNTITIL